MVELSRCRWSSWIGNRAERAAERHLKRRGLKVLHRNYTSRRGEIDLVMEDGETLVFVEVRFRKPASWADGLASVDRGKQRRIIRAASDFLARNRRHRDRFARFDVVSVTKGNYRLTCDWTPNAFEGNT